jgi:hypothetical protein
LRPTHICGRTECVPPRNRLSRHLGALSARRPVLGLAPPRRGGLRTPSRTALAPSGHVPVGDPAPPGHLVKTESLGTRLAIPCGRTECAPPRNRLSRHLGALSARRPVLGLAPPRRGGLRTPAGKVLAPPGHVPVGDPTPPGHLVKTESLGTRLATPCGRTECVPPRKPPFASSPSFPSNAIRAALAPRRGAGSARPQGTLPFHRGIAPLGHQAFICPR